jgi:site-specific recombinase XerD
MGYTYDYNGKLRELTRLPGTGGERTVREWDYTVDGLLTAERYSEREFFAFINETNIPYNQVTPGIGDEYRAYLLTRERDLSRGTVNNKLNRIGSFYQFLTRKRLIHSDPFADMKSLKTGKTLPKNILSIEDMGPPPG